MKPDVLYSHLWWNYVKYGEGIELWRNIFGSGPQFYTACVADLVNVFFGRETLQARIAAFDFLKHGGIEELAHSQKIADECYLGENGEYLDMIRSGCDITDLLAERCRREVAKRDARVGAAYARAARLQKEVKELKASFAYRVGMFVTWPARKLWRLVTGNREQGTGNR